MGQLISPESIAVACAGYRTDWPEHDIFRRARQVFGDSAQRSSVVLCRAYVSFCPGMVPAEYRVRRTERLKLCCTSYWSPGKRDTAALRRVTDGFENTECRFGLRSAEARCFEAAFFEVADGCLEDEPVFQSFAVMRLELASMLVTTIAAGSPMRIETAPEAALAQPSSPSF